MAAGAPLLLPQYASLYWRAARHCSAALRRAIMAAHAPLYCRSPPRSTGELCAFVLPHSAAVYYCREAPRRATFNGGMDASLLPRAASLYWRAGRDLSAAIRRALVLPESSLPRCAGGLFSAPIFVKYEIPIICISYFWLTFFHRLLVKGK